MAGMGAMLQYVRAYLTQHFGGVKDEVAEGKYVVFIVNINGTIRNLKVHHDMSAYTGSIPQYLTDANIADQLLNRDVEIKPLLPSTQI